MKVIAKKTDEHGRIEGVVVEMSPNELAILGGGARATFRQFDMENLRDGSDIDICDRFDYVMVTERRIAEAQKVGESLRAMASAVDAVVNSVKEAILPPEPEPAKPMFPSPPPQPRA